MENKAMVREWVDETWPPQCCWTVQCYTVRSWSDRCVLDKTERVKHSDVRSHLILSVCPPVSLHPSLERTSLPLCLCLCVSPSLSLPVSCALFQGWGLRHTFHLAYEALILFRAWSEREKEGDRREERGMWMWGVAGWNEGQLSPPLSCFNLVFHFRKK